MQKEIEKRKVQTTSWMVRRVILHMMAFGLLMVPLYIALLLIGERLPTFISSPIYFLLGALIAFWAIKMSFKVIFKSSFLSLEQVPKIANGVVSVAVSLQVFYMLYWYYKASPIFSQALITIASYIIWDVFLFLVVCYWGKKFAKN